MLCAQSLCSPPPATSSRALGASSGEKQAVGLSSWAQSALSPSCSAKKKKTSKDVPVITFRDVAGVDSAKVELLEVVACLQDARRYAKLNAKMPSGVLLCGPPGTGKTLLGGWCGCWALVCALVICMMSNE